jgi:hypothetical protein
MGDEIKEHLDWLKNMGAQLGANMVPRPKAKEPEDLKEQGRWMDAPLLVERVEEVRQEALEGLQAMERGELTRLEAAGIVHDALMATMSFGYMPPMRDTSVLLTLTKPPHKGCIHPDCQHKVTGCLGNRVFKDVATGGGVPG